MIAPQKDSPNFRLLTVPPVLEGAQQRLLRPVDNNQECCGVAAAFSHYCPPSLPCRKELVYVKEILILKAQYSIHYELYNKW